MVSQPSFDKQFVRDYFETLDWDKTPPAPEGVLPPAERHLAKNQEGERLIRELKEKLIEKAKSLLKVLIEKLTKAEVVDIHSGFEVETGERIKIFTLNKDWGKASLSGSTNYEG